MVVSGRVAHNNILQLSLHPDREILSTNLNKKIKVNYSSYCGKLLEQFFFELLANTGEYNRLGSYWERGRKNEIDIIALNDMKKIMLIAEVKTNKDKNSLTRLQYRSEKLVKHYHDYQIEYKLLSLDDAIEYL